MEQNVFKMYDVKAKAYSSKKYKKIHGINAKKLSYIDQKYEKWKLNEKLPINVNTLWGVIYVHFYSWDRSLDFLIFVYDLI